MADPAVTYTFANSTTADATQVNQNFTDLIASLTDGTKSLTIDAITAGGTATLSGSVLLGNGTPDDISFLGSLATSVPIKTTNSFDIGTATLGLASVYLGSSGGAFTTRIKGAAVGSSYTFTLPLTGGSDGYLMETNGSGTTTWVPTLNPTLAENYSISCSVGSSALTVTMNGGDGNALSSTNRAKFVFRNATAATGTPVLRVFTSSPSITVPSTATLGHLSGADEYIYVYLMDNAGTAELVVSGRALDEGSVQSTDGVGTGSDYKTKAYSTSSRSNLAVRFLARLKSNQAATGTWASLPTEISLIPPRSSQWYISDYIVAYSGVRQTSSPTALGQYRTLIKQNAAVTVADTDGSAQVSAANGLRIYAVSGGGAGTTGEPNAWSIHVGKQKKVMLEFYRTTGRAGIVMVNREIEDTNGVQHGVDWHYDTSTGNVYLRMAMTNGFGASTRYVGTSYSSETAAYGDAANCYFDILVVEEF